MTEYAFFAEKADKWGKDLASLWVNFNICPQLYQLELPCHSRVEMSSISIITTLPDPLGSGTSLIATKHIYLEIDIPSPPMEEPDQKMPPLKDIHTILITSPPKSKGSMTTEVHNLLSQAVLEASSCESQQSPPRRVTTAVVPTSPPQRPEGLPLPADTSSQASIDEGEAFLDDIPTNISPIAAISGSDSTSTSMDLAEL